MLTVDGGGAPCYTWQHVCCRLSRKLDEEYSPLCLAASGGSIHPCEVVFHDLVTRRGGHYSTGRPEKWKFSTYVFLERVKVVIFQVANGKVQPYHYCTRYTRALGHAKKETTLTFRANAFVIQRNMMLTFSRQVFYWFLQYSVRRNLNKNYMHIS